MSAPEPTPSHPYGVRIPPDEGDANWRGAEAASDAYLRGLASLLHDTQDSTWQVQASMVAEYARRYAPNTPTEPHTPASAPNTPPLVSP